MIRLKRNQIKKLNKLKMTVAKKLCKVCNNQKARPKKTKVKAVKMIGSQIYTVINHTTTLTKKLSSQSQLKFNISQLKNHKLEWSQNRKLLHMHLQKLQNKWQSKRPLTWSKASKRKKPKKQRQSNNSHINSRPQLSIQNH